VTDDRMRIAKIRECIENIETYTAKDEKSFYRDTKTQDAVLRNFQILGQAIKDLSNDIKREYPADWAKAAQFRDKITHDYFSIDLEIVWKAIVQKLPPLRQTIDQIEKDKKIEWEKKPHSKLKKLIESDE
jgi:uncharacterized protein with HEPN domain